MSMDIFTPPGKKVTAYFKGGVLQHGQDWQREEASKYLKPKKKYTIEKINVYDWHSEVYLKEFPGVQFNSVHFINV